MTGLMWGVGNTIFGTLTHKGFWAGPHTGPFGLAMLLIYRLTTMCKVRARKGVWVDKSHSNFYDEAGAFRYANLVPLTVMWVIPVLTIFIISYGFNFALASDMNQGIVVCLFNVTVIYVSVVFYLKFGETVPCIKAFGMFLVVLCVVFLCIESGEKDNEIIVDAELPFEMSKTGYAFLAVVCGLTAPILFSFKAVYVRLSMS